MTAPAEGRFGASFRDPSGFLYRREGVLLRQVNASYQPHYDKLRSSGLYDRLAGDGLLVPHEELPLDHAFSAAAYRVLKPAVVPFVSYPYEWCFSQLKDAALATLKIQKRAFESGMVLKDASAFNIQFLRGRPILIDTLSLEEYVEGSPWVAYRQFCQHFLAPLALMSRRDVRLGQLSRIHIDGIPLDLAAGLLPGRTRLSFTLLTHIHLHARSQKTWGDRAVDLKGRRMGRLGFQGLIDSLEGAVSALTWKPAGSEWADYYQDTNYSPRAQEAKARIVAAMVREVGPGLVWDLGANTGFFSRIAAAAGANVVSFDLDPAAVEKNYLQARSAGETNLLPLVMDFANPSPDLGWAGEERESLARRGPADALLALALVHHLAIGNNVPLARIASFLAALGEHLIVEFVPKEDSQVRRLLRNREDIFPEYSAAGFETALDSCFHLIRKEGEEDSPRVLYALRRK